MLFLTDGTYRISVHQSQWRKKILTFEVRCGVKTTAKWHLLIKCSPYTWELINKVIKLLDEGFFDDAVSELMNSFDEVRISRKS